MILSRRSWLTMLGASTLCVTTRSVTGQPGEVIRPDRAITLRPGTNQAISRGLDYLVRSQNEDGSFGSGLYSRNVGVCAIAGLALMANGSTPDRGTYAQNVNSVLRFLLECCQESGFITYAGATSHGPMYEHGFATLMLAESYGMSHLPHLRSKLAAAVRLIVDKQNPEGGWRYQPERRDADLSVTICQVMALRAAKNAGLYVPKETIDRCIDYVKRSQNADGGFMYMLSAGGPSKFPRSAAGVVALYSAGVYEGEEIRRGLDYLVQFTPGKAMAGAENYYFYGHYYAVQAMWQAGGEYWRNWYPAIERELLGLQRGDGSWADTTSPQLGTAMACMILQTPRNHLPIFQK